MAKFMSRCILEVAPKDNGKWVVMDALLYRSDVARRLICVPRGFKTDLASVPRYPIIYWLTGGTSNEAAVIHDWLYSSHIIDRKTADQVLMEASRITGVPKWRRLLMYWGVRIGGGSHWAGRKRHLCVATTSAD